MSTTENDPALSPGDKLTYEQIAALSNNMYAKLHITDGGVVRPLDPTKDTKAVYIEKSKLDALFAANPGSDGLRVYFGVHDSKIFKPSQPNYENKLMVSFVATTKEVDNLDKPVNPEIVAPTLTEGGGTGTTGGKVCPPDTGCF